MKLQWSTVTVSQDANPSETQEHTFLKTTGLIAPYIFHTVFWPVSSAMKENAYMPHVYMYSLLRPAWFSCSLCRVSLTRPPTRPSPPPSTRAQRAAVPHPTVHSLLPRARRHRQWAPMEAPGPHAALAGSWSLPCLSKSSHAPAATSAAPSSAAAQSRFTFLSDTPRQLRRCSYARGSFVARFPSIVLKRSFP